MVVAVVVLVQRDWEKVTWVLVKLWDIQGDKYSFFKIRGKTSAKVAVAGWRLMTKLVTDVDPFFPSCEDGTHDEGVRIEMARRSGRAFSMTWPRLL